MRTAKHVVYAPSSGEPVVSGRLGDRLVWCLQVITAKVSSVQLEPHVPTGVPHLAP